MSTILSHPDVRFAIDTVRQAGELARNVQQELASHALAKEDRSPVTVADFAVQALAGCLVQQTYPHEPLVAEEASEALRTAEGKETLDKVNHFVGKYLAYATPETVCDWIDRGNSGGATSMWVLDPVDGTKGFLRGEQYAVALAYIVNGEVRVGALACPNLTDAYKPEPGGPGTVIAAIRGEGTWAAPMLSGDFRQLKVSGRDNIRDARVLRSVEAGHTNVDRLSALMEDMGVEAEPVRMDSQAKYAVLADGRGDLLFRLLSKKQPDYKEKIWDQAAGSIVTEEAGGTITDLSGKPLDFSTGTTLANNSGVLASNGKLHDEALEALAKIGESTS